MGDVCLCSNVKDMTSVLEVTVFDEDRDHKVEFLGRVVIPLLRIHNGEKRWYSLKDKTMFARAKGTSPQVSATKHTYDLFMYGMQLRSRWLLRRFSHTHIGLESHDIRLITDPKFV